MSNIRKPWLYLCVYSLQVGETAILPQRYITESMTLLPYKISIMTSKHIGPWTITHPAAQIQSHTPLRYLPNLSAEGWKNYLHRRRLQRSSQSLLKGSIIDFFILFNQGVILTPCFNILLVPNASIYVNIVVSVTIVYYVSKVQLETAE